MTGRDLFYSLRRPSALVLGVLFVGVIFFVGGHRTASAGCGSGGVPGNRVDKVAFFTEVARQIRDPSIPESALNFAVQAFLAWEPYENTAACWNPLATTLAYRNPPCRSWRLPGNGAGVQEYPSRACGIQATAGTLNYTFNGNGQAYRAIRRMLAKQAFDEAALRQALHRWIGYRSYEEAVIARWRALYYSTGGGGGPAGYTFCAQENRRCNFGGTKDVAYGANGRYSYHYGVTGGIDCNNDTFGDPLYDVVKACYVRNHSSEPVRCSGQYQAEYFNNRTLSGSPALVRCERWPIDHDWAGGRPGPGVNDDRFSARWTDRVSLGAGTYTFVARSDDGVRVWLDNDPILNAWRDQPPTEYRVTRHVNAGQYTIKVEYYENGGGAVAQFHWERASSCTGPSISLEQTVRGRLDGGTPRQVYCLTVPSRQWVSVRMFATGGGNLDPYVRVLSPSGTLLAKNDDGVGIGYSSFLSVRLPRGGTYRIEATRYDSTAGSYALRVERGLEAAVGDLDRNCVVDASDRNRLQSWLGQYTPDADLDLNGVVNTRDLIFQMRNMDVRCD